MEDWILGLILVFLGCCCSAVGLVLLKHSTNVEEHLPLTKRPFWAIGEGRCHRPSALSRGGRPTAVVACAQASSS